MNIVVVEWFQLRPSGNWACYDPHSQTQGEADLWAIYEMTRGLNRFHGYNNGRKYFSCASLEQCKTAIETQWRK